jgi:hypothetical protein
MSLTSYRAAPPRVGVGVWVGWVGGPGGDLLSRVLRRSTMGAGGFHGRVRDGIGWVTPRQSHQVVLPAPVVGVGGLVLVVWVRCGVLLCRVGDIEPVGRLGPVGCVRCRTCTSGLSTCWSCTALGETWF